MRYRVESWERPDLHHVVDLSELGGNGECGCADFRARCFPNFRANDGKWVNYGHPGRPNPARTQCKHIFCARLKFTDDTLRAIAEQLTPAHAR